MKIKMHYKSNQSIIAINDPNLKQNHSTILQQMFYI